MPSLIFLLYQIMEELLMLGRGENKRQVLEIKVISAASVVLSFLSSNISHTKKIKKFPGNSQWTRLDHSFHKALA
jgi:hypothetical protein